MSLENVYHGKRVVVTGGLGFVGRHLCRRLNDLGAEVIIMDDGSNPNILADGFGIPLKVFRYSVEHPWACTQGFYKADYVFNLAATVAGVKYNQNNNHLMYEQNARIQLTPLKMADGIGAKFLQVSSVCVYADMDTSPCDDTGPLAGLPNLANRGYGMAKRIGEAATTWFPDLHSVIVRPSNIYGPGDHFDLERSHVIPALIHKVMFMPVVEVYGTGEESREFLYVKDAAEGMIHAMAYGDKGHVYNLGTDGQTAIKIGSLVKLIMQIIGVEKEVRFLGSDRVDPGDQERWSKAQRIFEDTGWEFKTTLAEGLQHTINWYQSKTNEE